MQQPSLPHHSRARWIGLGLAALSLYVILPQTNTFKHSFQQIHAISLGPVIGAVFTIGLTFFLAAITYQLLARQPLLYRRTVLVALANMFTNRLLPAGTGSIATFFIYLRRRRHSVSQASSVVAVNNLLGLLSHGCLLVLLVIVAPKSFSGLVFPAVRPIVIVGAIAGIGILGLFVASKKAWRRRLRRLSHNLRHDLAYYRHYPLRLCGAFMTSLVLTLVNAATLWFCCLAVQVAISPVAALAIFSLGIVVGTLTPTPGGVGGAEAGLLAGLIAYRIGSSPALAAVLLYRLLSYWLTLIVGAVTYVYIDRRGYLKPRSRTVTKNAITN